MENIGNKFEYVRSGASWEQVKKNLKLLSHHWPETISVNMVYSLFSAFDILETIQEFHALGIKKITLFNINGNSAIDLFNMPKEIKQKALVQLQMAREWHQSALHPEDRELYPWDGADQLIAKLNTPTSAPILLSEFNSKIKWYDQWSSRKFANLWPEVNQLVHSNLK
jgi:hypothetical protein